MALFSWLGKSEGGESELPEIFPLRLQQDTFTTADILATFVKILTDTMERTHGLPKKYEPLLWDNCVQNEANRGLISLLADAMANKGELFLVFSPSVNVLRVATFEEKEQIRKDYQKNSESSAGVFISFKNYNRSEMLQIYSQLEYCILASLHKTVNISKAIQIKINDLRSGVSLQDASVARDQAKSIASALRNGKDVYLDRQDDVTTATPDTSSTEKAIAFLDAKRAFILGLPMAYISGLQTGGLNSSGTADTMAVERGLKQYFVSILQPSLKAIFGAETEFKSQDFNQISSALEALKTFEITSNEIMSKEAKQEVTQRMFDLDPEEEKKALADEAAQAEKDAKKNPAPAPAVDENGKPAPQPSANGNKP